ncbi:MAG: dihydrolipoyl dehydrogenase [Halanaerobacter sp.]
MEIKLSEEMVPDDLDKAEIISIKVQSGDKITAEEVVMDLEADKTNISLTANRAGEVDEILVAEEDEVEVGTVLMTIDSTAEEDFLEEESSVEKRREEESEITIIGGGPGGYVAALEAAKQGADVTLVEKESLGGTCLNWGCIPTKALVRSAEVYTNLKEAADFGCRADGVDFKWSEIIKRKENIVAKLKQGIDSLLAKHNVEVIAGQAQLLDEGTVGVMKDTEELVIESEEIILATGSQSVELPIVAKEAEDKILYSKEALDLDELPEKMVIIGGGVIGLEFAFIFSRLDVEVTVIEYLDEVLSMLDSDLIAEITEAAQEDGIQIYTSAEVKKIRTTADGEALVEFKREDKEEFITAAKVLMAVGRRPDLGGLDVDKIGVEIDERTGGIQVNDKMETSVDGIYAIGDVTGKTQLAHAASHQGIVAVENIRGQEVKMDYNALPKAIFTAPEIAAVGLTEEEAASKDREIAVGKFPVAANGKALTLGETTGFIKLISDAETGQILGGAIIGPHATDLIAEMTLALKNELSAEEVIETVHAHPTSAESIHEAALALRPEGALHYAD